MAKGISIGVASDTREFSKGVKDGVIKPLEDASDALDAVAKDGDKAGDKLEKAFDEARKDTSKFKDEQTELGRAMQRASKEGGDSYRTNVKDGLDSGKESLGEFKDEAQSTAKETAASFDGSADSIVGAFQEIAANAFGGFGPAGMVAGLAAAAGIGIISAAMQNGDETGEKLQARIGEITDELIDSKRGGVSLDYLVDKLKSLASEAEDTNLEDLAKTAKDSGSDFRDLAQAYSGNADGLKDLRRQADDYLKSLRDQADAVDTTTNAGVKAYSSLIKQADAQETYLGYLDQSVDVAKTAAEAQENYAKAGGPELEQKAAILAGLSDQISDAASSWEDYQNKETGAIDIAAYLANMQARIDANNNYVANLDILKAQMTPEAFEQVIQGGPDLAPLVDSVAHASPEIQAQFAATYAAAAAQANGEIAGIDSNVDVTVTTKADTKPATADLFKVRDDKSIITTIGTKANTQPAADQIAAAAAQPRTATIEATVDLSGARTALENFVNKSRTTTITVKAQTPDGKQVY
ncbi:hypothetical protein [Agreia sp. VKM Ac-1783]|uniref:hypothetical protein n=1 Tax=Agreia sp. VKM Ac-1783 TaxID=1938889 RepID=UPI000A2AD260|nr:hypothetical protein [Agreia sp. VKM Ac-1783]SMQ73465.1 hypothetical protein SAMN06295943_2887 [Agreia sp. VKM Ac-1783]